MSDHDEYVLLPTLVYSDGVYGAGVYIVILYLFSSPICSSGTESDCTETHHAKKSADGPALHELLNLCWNPLDTLASTVHLF